MNDPLLILITFDTDYDFYYTPNKEFSQTKMKEEMLSWRSLEVGIPIINEHLRNYTDSFGNSMKFTWFLLSDKRQKDKFNDFTIIFKKYYEIWDDLSSHGDEMGLHVHLIEKQKDIWMQSTDDDRNIETLKEILSNWKKILHFNSVRFGYCYQSNRLMNFLDENQIKIDSSALPKRKMVDRQYFDWFETPEIPYYPSKSNYKVPGEEHYNVLEVPFSIFLSKLEDDINPLYRYLNLSFHPFIIKDAIKEIIKNRKIFHSITHFFEFIPQFNLAKKDNLLISFNKKALSKNLEQIIRECNRVNRKYRFITISDLLQYNFT